jgi:hypothetical protein
MGKLMEARIREGRIEPTESVQLPPDGTEVLVSLEEADRANDWFGELHALLAPVRAEIATESEDVIDERIAWAVRTSRTKERGKT